jgi:hypothetical protein
MRKLSFACELLRIYRTHVRRNEIQSFKEGIKKIVYTHGTHKKRGGCVCFLYNIIQEFCLEGDILVVVLVAVLASSF